MKKKERSLVKDWDLQMFSQEKKIKKPWENGFLHVHIEVRGKKKETRRNWRGRKEILPITIKHIQLYGPWGPSFYVFIQPGPSSCCWSAHDFALTQFKSQALINLRPLLQIFPFSFNFLSSLLSNLIFVFPFTFSLIWWNKMIL